MLRGTFRFIENISKKITCSFGGGSIPLGKNATQGRYHGPGPEESCFGAPCVPKRLSVWNPSRSAHFCGEKAKASQPASKRGLAGLCGGKEPSTDGLPSGRQGAPGAKVRDAPLRSTARSSASAHPRDRQGLGLPGRRVADRAPRRARPPEGRSPERRGRPGDAGGRGAGSGRAGGREGGAGRPGRARAGSGVAGSPRGARPGPRGAGARRGRDAPSLRPPCAVPTWPDARPT